jgi:RPA family protein
VSDSGAGAGRREVAWRLFAAEYDDAWHSYSQSDEERAPNYVVSPTGARVNRLFVVGVLTEVEPVSDEVLRARVVDPTGPFVVYAGQYQPEALAFLERAEPPTFVAVTGKARTFQPDDADVVYTSIRPETINEVDAETRDRWVVATAEQTLDRITHFADALDRVERGDVRRSTAPSSQPEAGEGSGDDLEDALLADGVDIGLAAGIPRAIEEYGTTPAYLDAVRDVALDAVRLVAGDGDEVSSLDLAPDEGGDAALDASFSILSDGVSVVSDEGGEVAGAASAASDAASESSTAEETGTAEGETDAEATEPDESTEPVEATASAGSEESETGGEVSTVETEPEPAESEPADESEPTETEAAESGPAEETELDADESAADEEDVSAPEAAAGVGDEMYEMDEEERERVEEEHGLEFSTGTEVESPEESEAGDGAGAAASEPEPDEDDAEEATEPASATEARESAEAEEATEAEPAEDQGAAEADAADLDPDELEDVVVEEMEALDDGEGAVVDDLVAAVASEYGVAESEVRDAIQDALMAGRCFEPDDEHVKPI